MHPKPPRRGAPKPVAIRATGGRGRRGPLGVWLLAHAARIQAAEADYTLRWDDIGRDAAADGVEVRPGEPYGGKAVSNAWGVLRRAGRVKRASGQGSAVPAQAAPDDGMVPSPRGQGGTASAGGDQPPTRAPPATPKPAPPGKQATARAPEQPKLTATDMPRRRRFGDED